MEISLKQGGKMKCPKCGSNKLDEYWSEDNHILLCLMCGHEWVKKDKEGN